MEQLSNKRKKEEYYKQWLELEPVVEVDDEEDHEENDSALSSAPSSMSPQPGGCGQWQGNGVTREAYEAVLVEIEDLQSKLLKEQWELSRAKIQVCDLEKALLQEVTSSLRVLETESRYLGLCGVTKARIVHSGRARFASTNCITRYSLDSNSSCRVSSRIFRRLIIQDG